jgi:hypothetical protein
MPTSLVVLSLAPREGAAVSPIFPLRIIAVAVVTEAVSKNGDTTNYCIQEIKK